MTDDALFIGLLILGMFFMIFSGKRRSLVVALVTFMIWFSIGMWLFFSTAAPIGFGEPWKDILGWAFLVLSLLPWLFQMDTEIRHEAQGRSWSVYGSEPKEKGPSGYDQYKVQLRSRTRRK